MRTFFSRSHTRTFFAAAIKPATALAPPRANNTLMGSFFKALGLTIPPMPLTRADEVLE
jgi:hypothetical protein